MTAPPDPNPPPSAADPGARFRQHFGPILCETDEDRDLLVALAELVRAFRHGDDELLVTVEVSWADDPVETVVCGPPYEGAVDPSVPASFETLARHHNGISWESFGAGCSGFAGLRDDGELSSFSWDPSYLDHSGTDAYADALAVEGLTFDDVREAFGAGQNWLVLDPLGENALGEPTVAFVGHVTCELEPVPTVDELGAGQVLLRLLACEFLEPYDLPGVYF